MTDAERERVYNLLLFETRLTGCCPLRASRGCGYYIPDEGCVAYLRGAKPPNPCLELACTRYLEEMRYDD